MSQSKNPAGSTKTDLTSDYKQLLESSAPNFSELVKTQFNGSLGFIRKKLHIANLDDVLISTEGNNIELRQLKFPWLEDFRIKNLKFDFNNLTVDVDLKVGDLRVEGEYEAYNYALQQLLPVFSSGKIEIKFHEVTATGLIGFTAEEDSIMTQNFDLKYTPREITVRVRYMMGEHEVENEITKTNLGETLGQSIWTQLTEVIMEDFQEHLGATVVENSVLELLEDEDHVLVPYSRERVLRANTLLDSLLCSAKDWIVAQDSRKFTTPALEVRFRGRPGGLHLGRLITGPGYLGDLSTLSRLEDASLYEDDLVLVVFGYVTLRECKHGYENYSSSLDNMEVSGSIHASVFKNKIFIRITVLKMGPECNVRLDQVHVKHLEGVSVDSSGLGYLSWLNPRLNSWVIGALRQSALPVLEDKIKQAFQHAIQHTDCVGLLID